MSRASRTTPHDLALELNGVANFTSATVDGVTYLYSNRLGDDGISVFRVKADGTLTNVQNITDDAGSSSTAPRAA